MAFPAFFLEVPSLRVRDPLAQFLGAADGGIIEYGYTDVVKLAGHSCPTVASAYCMTRRALRTLYGDDLPERGGVAVAFRDPVDAGVTGVMGSVVSLITGAAGEGGFKGLGGRFVRRGLLAFGGEAGAELRFTRLDTGHAVDVSANVREVPADDRLPGLVQQAVAGTASPEEARLFAELWQDRVRRILLEHADDPRIFPVRKAKAAWD